MFRETAGKARQVGLFNSTTESTTGYVSKGLPPTNGDELVEVFKSALMFWLSQVDSMRFFKFLHATIWSVAKHSDHWIQRAVDDTMVYYPGMMSPKVCHIYGTDDSGRAKYHSLRTIMDGLSKKIKEQMISISVLYCDAYLSSTSREKKGFSKGIEMLIKHDELCDGVIG